MQLKRRHNGLRVFFKRGIKDVQHVLVLCVFCTGLYALTSMKFNNHRGTDKMLLAKLKTGDLIRYL